MSKLLHKIKVGNQTNKILRVVPNQLEPKLISPQEYAEWNSYPFDVIVQVTAETRFGEVLHLGEFEYSNVGHNYADIGFVELPIKRETTELVVLDYYLEGDTIYTLAYVEKAVWDSLIS